MRHWSRLVGEVQLFITFAQPPLGLRQVPPPRAAASSFLLHNVVLVNSATKATMKLAKMTDDVKKLTQCVEFTIELICVVSQARLQWKQVGLQATKPLSMQAQRRQELQLPSSIACIRQSQLLHPLWRSVQTGVQVWLSMHSMHSTHSVHSMHREVLCWAASVSINHPSAQAVQATTSGHAASVELLRCFGQPLQCRGHVYKSM